MNRIQGKGGDAARHVSTEDTMHLTLLFRLPSQYTTYYQTDTVKLHTAGRFHRFFHHPRPAIATHPNSHIPHLDAVT